MLLLGYLQLAQGGCARGPDRLSKVEAIFSSDGALHLASRLRSGEGEGGGWRHIAWLYARKDVNGAVTRFEPSAEGRTSSHDDHPQFLVEGAAGQYLFIETGIDPSFWIDPGGGWTQVFLDASLPSEARYPSGLKLRAAWRDPDNTDAVLLLTNKWLYRIEGNKVVEALAVSGTCGAQGLCYVAPPSGSAETMALTFSATEALLSQMSCDAGQGECTWTETGSTLGTSDMGGTSSRRARRFFFAKNANGEPTLVFVRNVQPASGHTYRVLATWPGGELELIPENSFFIGAAPLPAGGYAVATETYDEELRLVLVEPDLTTKREVGLGRQPDGFMNNWLTVLGSGTSSADQRVHIFFGVGSTTVQHLTIDPAGGTIEDDELIELR